MNLSAATITPEEDRRISIVQRLSYGQTINFVPCATKRSLVSLHHFPSAPASFDLVPRMRHGTTAQRLVASICTDEVSK